MKTFSVSGTRIGAITSADEDASLGVVARRAALSALGDSVHRILGDDPTAAPAAGLSFLIGFGALWLSIASNFPPMNRFFDGVIAVGFLGTGFVAMRRPRELERTRLLPCLVVASVGLAGGALSLPISAATGVFDVLAKAALVSAAVGFAIVAAALVPAHVNRAWFTRGGALLWVSALVLAAGEIGWAVTGTGFNLATGASLVIAVGCVVVAAILGRLRHIPIRS